MWALVPVTIALHDQKVILQLVLIILTYAVQWCQHYWHHGNAAAIGVTSPIRSCCTSLDHLDLMIAVVPLMMLSKSHYGGTNAMAPNDTNTNASGIMCCQC